MTVRSSRDHTGSLIGRVLPYFVIDGNPSKSRPANHFIDKSCFHIAWFRSAYGAEKGTQSALSDPISR